MNVTQLVQEYHGGVYRYAYRLTGSVADAEDLTQQVFLIAQQKLAQLRTPECAQSWLFAILRNSFLKSRKKRRPIPAGDLNFDVERIPSEIREEEEIDSDRLQEAINELPEAFRIVLVMFYYEDCSYREIAEQLELPMGTVMSRLARAKGHLRARLFEAQTQGAAPHHPSSVKRSG